MAKIKTSELEGAALDWAVAKVCRYEFNGHWFKPSTDWSQGGPLIEDFSVEIGRNCFAWLGVCDEFIFRGNTPLIAACRAIVAAKLGDVVDVPDELA